MKDDNASRLRAHRVFLREDDCDLDAFRALVERSVNPPIIPSPPTSSPTRSSTTATPCAKPPRARDAPRDDGGMGRGDDRRAGPHRLPQALRRPSADRGGQRPFLGDDRRAAPKQFGARRPFRQARRERPRVERVGKALPRRSRKPSPPITATTIIALVSEAWLGPCYQITSQLNVVNPGGEAQVPHRDYHMGFQTAREIERFPAHAHRLSPMLTLQGAVAHCDMPLESGPTLYLPFSQTYLPGYLAALREDFRAYFEAHKVQLPLETG